MSSPQLIDNCTYGTMALYKEFPDSSKLSCFKRFCVKASFTDKHAN